MRYFTPWHRRQVFHRSPNSDENPPCSAPSRVNNRGPRLDFIASSSAALRDVFDVFALTGASGGSKPRHIFCRALGETCPCPSYVCMTGKLYAGRRPTAVYGVLTRSRHVSTAHFSRFGYLRNERLIVCPRAATRQLLQAVLRRHDFSAQHSIHTHRHSHLRCNMGTDSAPTAGSICRHKERTPNRRSQGLCRFCRLHHRRDTVPYVPSQETTTWLNVFLSWPIPTGYEQTVCLPSPRVPSTPWI